MMGQPPFGWRVDVHMAQGTKRKRDREPLKGDASCELKEKRKNSFRGRKQIHSGRRRDMRSG